VRIQGSPPPFHYRWRRASITVYNDFSDQLTSTLTLTNVTLANAGNYTVVVTNIASIFPGTLSSSATLTVLQP
jgi:hypothetical protein